MGKVTNKAWALVLASVVAVNMGTVNIVAAEDLEKGYINDAEKEINIFYEEKYSPYYEIYDVDITPIKDDEGYEYFASADVVIKYESVSEEPYFKGMIDALHLDGYDMKWDSYEDVCESVEGKAYLDDIDISKYYDSVAYVLWSEYENLDSYIGTHQDLDLYFKTEIVNGDVKLLVENIDEYVSTEQFTVNDYDAQYEWGYNTIMSRCSDIMVGDMNVNSVMSSEQNRSYAINYAKTYTSNPSICSYCGSSTCDGMQNTSYWNLSTYPTYANHNDCASYVSQALKAGGHSTDSSWYFWSNPWKQVQTLITYLTVSYKITSTTFGSCYSGDIAYANDYSHIIMITGKDGTTIKFSAHTHDRKNVTFGMTSSYTVKRVLY